MTVNAEKFQYGNMLPIGDETIGVRGMLPQEEKERMAQDYVSAAMAFDEEAGIAYEGYNAELSRAFLILRYYTDLDLTPYDTPQGRYEICDIIASHGLWPRIMEVVGEDISGVNAIVGRLEEAARRNFERKYSLDYRLGRLLEGLLGTESLVENIAKAESLNSRLIDMLGALRASPSVKAGVPLAKRRDAEDANPAG